MSAMICMYCSVHSIIRYLRDALCYCNPATKRVRGNLKTGRIIGDRGFSLRYVTTSNASATVTYLMMKCCDATVT
jgi:hypothetical protein